MKKLVRCIVAAALLSPTVATGAVIYKDNPSLVEIQAGLDACNKGDVENCKYWRYPGVVRVVGSDTRIGPSDAKYILGDVLKPGTVLPYVEDPAALLASINKSKKGKVTIVSYLASELQHVQLASNDDFGAFLQDYVQHAALTPEIVELAAQNGITPIQMYEHIQVGLELEHQAIVDDLNAQHNAIVEALSSQIEGLQSQVQDLQAAINSLQEEHAAVVATLEAQIETLENTAVAQALENKQLREELEEAISLAAQLNKTINELQETVKANGETLGDQEEQIKDLTAQLNGILSSMSEGRDWFPAADFTPVSVDQIMGELTKGNDGSGSHTGLARMLMEFSYEIAPGQARYFNDILPPESQQALVDMIRVEVQKAYDSGYAEGYDAGYNDGYADGYAAGSK